ncbi:hypothetical protein LTR02_014355 [Friedmanniomyces endolithicus]|nr:hypothetical protein LTR75_015288 [Friedmanniomyces endolithicus]KAK0841771.1 hypothetical protein LTS02_016716 [Friedmanniomyces endolithicus]KAK0847043.1 hypothetical protein LTR03_006553 [Friedmanniomyces endolithicus]KAK0890953.1 hypothetical protein LTR02_014355 [Friedmanniomyces endolithicus]KAK0954180.1 hypothetical protein LTS01_024038 [Friedmanniomyces endolithicus]
MHTKRPTIHLLRDLTTICEVHDSNTRHSNFSYVDEHDYAWFGQAFQPKLTLDAVKVSQALESLPDAKAYPLALGGLIVVADKTVPSSTTLTLHHATSDEDEVPMSVAEFVPVTNPIEELDSPLYEIRSLPGNGRGLVARFDISQGSRILVETPLLVAHNMPSESLEPTLAAKLKLLSRGKQRQFLSLHNNFPGRYPFSGTVKTNPLPCGPESDIGGVYATASLINHSCLPNAHNNWNPDDGRETIHAIQSISSGEEITICYSKGGPSTDRRSGLKQAFGFDCDCSTCSLPPVELQASDARRLRIQQLDNAVGDPVRMMHNPIASIADCKSLLNLLEMEHGRSGSALFARLYYDAFQISIAHGDQARAAVFAKRAYEERVLCEGEDSPSTRKMKDLMRTPTNHSSFAAYSSCWKSKRDAMPKGVNSVAYDRWLWRDTE